MSRKIFISYLDDDDKKVSGLFDLIEQTVNYVKVQTGSNVITIPYHRVLKVKENVGEF